MPEKVQKLSQRLMSLWLKRELLGIGTLAMLASAHAEENGRHTLPRKPAVFLTLASLPSRNAPIPISSFLHWWIKSKSSGARAGKDSIEGFQFRCWSKMPRRPTIFANRNCRHVRLGLNPCVTISTDFFGYFLSRKESNGVKPVRTPTHVKPILFFLKMSHYCTFNLRQFLLHFFNERKLSQEN